jgi:hypothetical protein
MSINLDPEDMDEDFWGDLVDNKSEHVEIEITQKALEPIFSTLSQGNTLESVGGVGGVIPSFKLLENNSIVIDVQNRLNTPNTPNSPEESAFFQITGHLPGDAWEGDLPDGYMSLARPIPWSEVMQGAEEERTWGRKSTLSLMFPLHEGKFEWYEHPLTKKWHSYATFSK